MKIVSKNTKAAQIAAYEEETRRKLRAAHIKRNIKRKLCARTDTAQMVKNIKRFLASMGA